MPDHIREFRGAHRFLSNFWPCDIFLDNSPYPSVEHAYQAAKTFNPNQRAMIQRASTPGQAKRLGKQVVLREDWEQVKIHIMKKLLQEKFSTPALVGSLLSTGDAVLTEGNHWGDTFWGVDHKKGGQNHLGILLMKIRSDLRGKTNAE